MINYGAESLLRRRLVVVRTCRTSTDTRPGWEDVATGRQGGGGVDGCECNPFPDAGSDSANFPVGDALQGYVFVAYSPAEGDESYASVLACCARDGADVGDEVVVVKVIRSLFSFPRLAEGCACGYSLAAESEYILDGRVECGIDPGGGEGSENICSTTVVRAVGVGLGRGLYGDLRFDRELCEECPGEAEFCASASVLQSAGVAEAVCKGLAGEGAGCWVVVILGQRG
jgi:hypothetical protein